ncbi:hypothetical protein CHS0354_041328 [Potamilus streckersoni]|uniref:TROVE domain-containing protein n=1 Tax=Potamilus streckersoni TaxID=2493646 RepID=A0AAE0VV78_9BIVA|nr:hypothetical protein CHS0354_041328 [Potamilus streckersoni]
MGNSSSRDTEPEDEDTYQYQPHSRRRGPEQSQKLQIHRKQVKNAFGGWVFHVDDMQRARRFLFMGSEGGTYTASNQLKRENAKCFDRYAYVDCIHSDTPYNGLFVNVLVRWLISVGRGKDTVTLIRQISLEGRAAKQGPTIFALAICASSNDVETKKAAYDCLNEVCRIPTHLFMFVKFAEGLEEAKKLQEELGNDENLQKILTFLEATEKARKCTDEKMMIELIKKHSLVREHVPTRLLNSKAVWETLLQRMPMTAMIRNLGKMTSMGLIDTGSVYEKAILKQLNDVTALKIARVHPFSVLVALNQYKKGHGDKGHLKWNPNGKVMTGLDLAFHAVEPTGKWYMLTIDVSKSMSMPCMGTESLTCHDAASAMMMVTFRTEEHCQVFAFSHELRPVPVTKEDRLDEVIDKFSKTPFVSIDCALPMLYAMEKKMKVDVFIVYTDNETWYGKVHPFKAIYDYRMKMEIYNAKLIVVCMSSNGFTIADPDDPNMLDIVGFDSGAIKVMNNFILD